LKELIIKRKTQLFIRLIVIMLILLVVGIYLVSISYDKGISIVLLFGIACILLGGYGLYVFGSIPIKLAIRGFNKISIKITRYGIDTWQYGIIQWEEIKNVEATQNESYGIIEVELYDFHRFSRSRKPKIQKVMKKLYLEKGYIELIMMDSTIKIDEVIDVINFNLNLLGKR
jgi:hypothetical protein